LGEYSQAEEVFGETPKTAVGTTALPKATAWFRKELNANQVFGKENFLEGEGGSPSRPRSPR
jgi:hypothetical protein